jgi:hypothetical protein
VRRGYLCRVPAEFLLIGPDGVRRAFEPDPDWGSAVLFVAPVTDALKKVRDGLVVGAVDREGVVSVECVGVSAEVSEMLEADSQTLPAIYREVLRLGFRWETRPTPVNLSPSVP